MVIGDNMAKKSKFDYRWLIVIVIIVGVGLFLARNQGYLPFSVAGGCNCPDAYDFTCNVTEIRNFGFNVSDNTCGCLLNMSRLGPCGGSCTLNNSQIQVNYQENCTSLGGTYQRYVCMPNPFIYCACPTLYNPCSVTSLTGCAGACPIGYNATADDYCGFHDCQSIVACTAEAKLCPDGVTYVGRIAPNCEFAACPNIVACLLPVCGGNTGIPCSGSVACQNCPSGSTPIGILGCQATTTCTVEGSKQTATCPNGKIYDAKNCVNGAWVSIAYFVDPCKVTDITGQIMQFINNIVIGIRNFVCSTFKVWCYSAV